MIKFESGLDSATKKIQDDEQRLQWIKPDAKIAEVAKATLSGVNVHNSADLQSCAS